MPPKKKSRPPPINYTSVDTASAAALDFDEWLADGVQQECQGDRYQHGAKAVRHYQNAIISYQLAASLSSPTAFDPVYNAARIMFTLATDHLEASKCIDMMQRAIITFRSAVSLAQSSDERIDSTFNLAQALVAMQELVDDGVVLFVSTISNLDPGLVDKMILVEAKQLFAQTEQLQRESLDQIFTNHGASSDLQIGNQDGSEALDATSTIGMELKTPTIPIEGTETVVEGRIVVPRQILETIMEAIELDLQLYTSPLTANPADKDHLAQSVIRAFSRAMEMSKSCSSSADLELSLAQIAISSTCSSRQFPLHLAAEQIMSTFHALVSSHPKDPSLLCSYADYVLEDCPTSSLSTHLLESALNAYQSALAIVSSRLTPPKDVPAHWIPSLMSSNLISQVETYLLLLHLSPEPSIELLNRAQETAIEAIKASGYGYGVELLPTVRILKLPGEGRRDWMTLKAFRQAWFWLIRVLIRVEIDGPETKPKQWMSLLRAWDKIVAPSGSANWRTLLEWFLSEDRWRGDRVWESWQGREANEWVKTLSG